METDVYVFPVSFAQQQLWFIDQWATGSPFYNIPVPLRLEGPLNIAVLEQSIAEIVRRHEILRTTLRNIDGQPVQVITPVPLVRQGAKGADRLWMVPVVDLEPLSKDAQEALAHLLVDQEIQQVFDLSQGPLLRTSLLRLHAQEHLLLLTIHHIVSDAWSIGVLFEELAALYSAFSSGRPSPLAELPIQYADFTLWQRDYLQGETLKTLMAYWKQQFSKPAGVLELSSNRSEVRAQTFQGAAHLLQLPRSLTDKLRALSKRTGTTLFMLLLAAFQVLLLRYSGQEDIVVGTPAANRPRRELEQLIGPFVNTLALRLDLSGNPTFLDLLARVRKMTLDAFDNQDLPFGTLVAALNPERSQSHSPLFQAFFTLHNGPQKLLALPQLRISTLPMELQFARFDISLNLLENAQGLVGTLEYNTSLFEPATIEALSGHFQALLWGIVKHPEHRLDLLPLLSEAESHRLLIEWNTTDADYPQQSCLHNLFERQAACTPDAVALVYNEEQLTYHELDRRASQLAQHLRSLGVHPETRVGLYLERSLDMVVGLLGILKSGGAYVPLDPAYPTARLLFMLTDASIPLLLTQAALRDDLLETTAHVLCLDSDWPHITQHSTQLPAIPFSPQQLAYVIYTSGSTGKPKGVQIQHQAVVNFLVSLQQLLGLHSNDILLAITTLSFDIATLEIFLPLSYGARTVILSRASAADGHLLAWSLQNSGATFLQATPMNWRLLLEAGWTGEPHLTMLCGGEALSHELAGRLFTRDAELWNLYGPTETTVWSTCQLVWQQAGARPRTSVPIGRPIANTHVYLLDKHLRPVPAGVPGELYIGGAGVARGYLNQPDLTAERFLPHPWSSRPGERFYKTGDLARYLDDGTLEFLGRADQQIKLRGYRIEPAEIETLLQQHPAIHEVLVTLHENAPGDQRLVAYVVADTEQEVTQSLVRTYLRSRIPEYMLPSVVIALERMPRTPNGKLDWRALPAPQIVRPNVQEAYVAPRSPLEEHLAAMLAELLGVAQVGIHDDFFELGGHSLLAMQFIARISRTFPVQISLHRLFDAPTIAGLSEVIELLLIEKVTTLSADEIKETLQAS